jgi:hypothetical protein
VGAILSKVRTRRGLTLSALSRVDGSRPPVERGGKRKRCWWCRAGLWVVTVRRGDLRLIARLKVDTIVNRAVAVRRLGRADLWPASTYVLPVGGTAPEARDIGLSHVARAIRFARTTRDRLTWRNGRINPQQLQRIRVLMPSTARTLERIWARPAAPLPQKPAFDPDSVADGRKKILAVLMQRQGQGVL